MILAMRQSFDPSRHPSRVFLLVLLVCLLALWPASRNQLETDLTALLPEGSPAAAAYSLYLDRFGGFEKVFVMVLGDSPDPVEGALLADAAEALAERLAESPEVRAVRVGLEPADERFLLRHVLARAPLLVPEESLPELAARLEPAAVEERAAWLAASLRRPGGGAELPLHRQDPLGLREFLPGGVGTGGIFSIDPVSGLFLSQDGTTALLWITPARPELDPEGGRALAATLDAACGEVLAEVEGLRCAALGGPLYAAQDEASLRQDLRGTVTGSLVLCGLLLVGALGGLRVPLLILMVLATALLWTAAAYGLAIGRLDAISLGFGAVLVGLGVDYCIHGATRFRQARLAGEDPARALDSTRRHSGGAIVTSALTTAAAFAALSLAHFRPIRQLGLLVALGMVAVLAATATVGALGLVKLPPPGEGTTRIWRLLGRWGRGVPALGRRHAVPVLVATTAVSVMAAVGLGQLTLDADLQRLRPGNHPAFEAERLLAHHFGLGTETATLLVPGDDLGVALERAAAVAAHLREVAPEASVNSPTDWLPPSSTQGRRLHHLAELPFTRAATTLEASLTQNGLAPRAFESGIEALRAWGEGRDPVGEPPPEEWPEPLAELLRDADPDADGSAWAALRLRWPESLWPTGPPPELVQDLETRVPGVRLAAAAALGRELKGVATADLRRLGTAALGAVFLVLALAFRLRPKPMLLALLPVTLGCLWTLGFAGLTGLPLDLFGLAIFPILLGIGIDDGLHAVVGAQGQGPGAIARSAADAGRAMVLTTATTACGFGSLALSHIPALEGGGALIAFGTFACLMATLLVLPAIETLFESAGAIGRGPEDEAQTV